MQHYNSTKLPVVVTSTSHEKKNWIKLDYGRLLCIMSFRDLVKRSQQSTTQHNSRDLKKGFSRCSPLVFSCKGIVLRYDNARPHTAKKTHDKLLCLSCEVVPHPLDSDISLTHYRICFLDNHMRYNHFKNPRSESNFVNECLLPVKK